MPGIGKTPRAPDEFFDVVPLPKGDGPVFLAIALPGKTLTSMPGFPQAALPQSGRVASGRGLTPEQARMSALGEAVELVSCCAWGDEPLIHASARELGPATLSPTLLNGFSPQQLAERESWNARYGDYDWRPPPYDETRRIDWIEVEDAFGGPKAYVPADFAFIGRKEAGDETAVAIGDSNGCASGATFEEAKTAAILELLERDAAARWWYGRASRPTMDFSILEAEPSLFRWLNHRSRRSHLVDITNDLDIPVVAAVSAECDGRDVVIGYAASVEIGIAASSAITEMAQIEFALEAVRTSARGPSHWAEWRTRVTLAHPPLGSIKTSSPGAPDGMSSRPTTLSELLDHLHKCRLPMWFRDMSRQPFRSPAIRAISPALAHTKPRFHPGRMRLPSEGRLEYGQSGTVNQVSLFI